ncbi:MAG: transglutaminase-like domain-containing protein [Candidatus Nanoarchaeia archaeon]
MLVSMVSAESTLNDKEELWLETTISSPVTFIKESSDASLDYLKMNYSWIPADDYRQELSSYESSPSGLLTNGVLVMETSQMNNFDLSVKFSTHSTSNPLVVSTKVPFPIKNLDSTMQPYLKSSEKIDINEDIRKKASELAAGEDDLYVVVFKLADWVNTNIEYNLSSSNVEASLPSSWVYENKQGVCDEISNLFISMCRSLGIPARFVSGIAYTDDEQFTNNWGPHGWAEVYFPGYGWVPFDPTYGQLGYVDATHIKFSGQTEDRNALEFSWLGKDIDVDSGTLEINGNVIKEGKMIEDDFLIYINFMKNEVGFDSYNVVEATIQNNRDYYIAANIMISKVEGVTVEGDLVQDVLLKPGERKKIYWIVYVENLKKEYIYTFPISVYSSNEKSSSEFKASSGKTKISLKTAQNYISAQGVSIAGPGLECAANKNMFYVGEKAEITCNTTSQRTLDFCIDDNCTKEKFSSITKNYDFGTPGFTTIRVSVSDAMASGEKTKSYAFLSFNVIDETKIDLSVSSPEKLMFEDQGEIKITLKRNSSSIPENIKIRIDNEKLAQEWVLDELIEDHNFIMVLEGKNLKNGINDATIIVEYYDAMGKKYSEEKQISIELQGLTFWQKIEIWLNGLI